MFNPNDLESVKSAFARGELTRAKIMSHPTISTSFTWDELEIADPVSSKFFGAYADEIAKRDSLLVKATKTIENGDFPHSFWNGRAVKVTFFLSDNNAPRALVRFPDGHQVTVKSIDFGTLREIVFWIDYVQYRITTDPK